MDAACRPLYRSAAQIPHKCNLRARSGGRRDDEVCSSRGQSCCQHWLLRSRHGIEPERSGHSAQDGRIQVPRRGGRNCSTGCGRRAMRRGGSRGLGCRCAVGATGAGRTGRHPTGTCGARWCATGSTGATGARGACGRGCPHRSGSRPCRRSGHGPGRGGHGQGGTDQPARRCRRAYAGRPASTWPPGLIRSHEAGGRPTAGAARQANYVR